MISHEILLPHLLRLQCFITISDCGVDFITPSDFTTESTVLGRIGEVRITSNLLSPPGPTQNYHISVADIGLYLSNQRVSHELENSGILCSNLFVHGGAQEPWSRAVPKSFEEAIGKLNFIALLNVDSLDIIVTLINLSFERNQFKSPSTISLSVGRVSLYACRDSLRCLSDTVGELVLILTSPQMKQSLPKGTDSISMEPKINERFVTITDAMDDLLFSESQKVHDMVEAVSSKHRRADFAVSNASPTHYPQTIQSDRSWTSIDYRWSDGNGLPEGEEQTTRWYHGEERLVSTVIPENATVIVDAASDRGETFKLFPQHISQNSSSHYMHGAEALMSELEGKVESLSVKLRILITDATLVCRFFDGYDWPQIPKVAPKAKIGDDTKSKLLGDLLYQDESASIDELTRKKEETNIPASEFITRKRRQTDFFFQFQSTGLKTRVDLFHESMEPRLNSFISLSLTDFVLAERLGSQRALKVVGEWVSDKEHPRDSNDGLLMLTVSASDYYDNCCDSPQPISFRTLLPNISIFIR